ncbi:MAG: hypothetical protein E3J86_14760 [Candidatus Thorarchaeota archaeon]|nr:MAG: hypothetical protein E3J86_14760 [Candidatus Thorarchaeota archaeon]
MTPALGLEDYVDSNVSDIDSSPDIGTHSNFASQQAGPDSTYDNLTEANGAPPPTNSEDDIDVDTSDVDITPDQGIEGTFTNAQGTALDSSYFAIQEESIISDYGGETGSVFVTGSVPDMADKDQFCLYQAIFWNPTDDVYEITRVEFSYTGSSWLKSISQGSGLSSPTTEWFITNKQVAYWAGSSPLTVQPHTSYPFYVTGKSNRINAEFYIDIGITANSSTFTESYHSAQSRGNVPGAQLWLGSSDPPTQIHSVSTGVQTTVYVSVEEDGNKADILSGGTLTIDVPAGFTGIIDVGGTNWGTATINGNQITVSNTAAIRDSYLTYAFTITSPSTPGLYKFDITFDDGLYAHPIGNFTIHVTGTPPTVEKINLEYQWSTATSGDTYEEVCIYVGSHTGSENLAVNYWDGFTWNVLGTISTTGWTNFTATGLTSSTYTIQLIGTSESSDSSKDLWNIDLITLHTWSLQTYNFKLDLEIQWTSANYTQDYEELCIYAGSLDAESIRVDVWNGAGWTNIASDLTPSSWNNFTINTWLTSSEFTIRFRGDIEVGDTTQSSWEIDVSLLHTWDNIIPQNIPTPSISNLDDTTYLYAQYRQYQLTADVNDGDGYADIDYFELTLTSDDQATEYWTIRYDEDTNSFTEQYDPSDYISLDNISSSAIEIGNSISATFFITINWNHPDVSITDLKSEVYDANPSSDSTYFEVNWDVETRLDTSSGPTLSDGSGTINRGDLDESMTASGTITYLGSGLHPAASDIDVWISSSEYGTQIGPWEATNYEDVGGNFSATVYADDLVGLDTFTFKAVEEGVGAGGSDLFVSSQSAIYISDRVQVQFYSTDDSRINVDGTANMHVTLYYDYDDSFVTYGSVTINSIDATYSGSNGVWDFNDTESAVQMNTYDTLVYNGGTHGLTGEDQNGQNLDQIWDRITVVSYSVIDDRVNVDTSVDIDVTLVYAYDSAAVTNGTVTVNTISATHQGGGVWRFSDTKATVQTATYNLVVAIGNTHEITQVDQNSQSQDVVWDQIIVISYSVLDDRVNLDDVVTINVTLEYSSDTNAVTDGVVTINLVLATPQGNGVWQITASRSTVQNVTYNSVVCSGNTPGITVVDQNSQSQDVIWDQITVRSYSVSNGRTNITGNVDIDVTIEYEYDDTPVLDGTVTINGNVAAPQGGGVWRITDSKAIIQLVTYDNVTCSVNSNGITNVNQNSQSTQVIWDQITVRGYEVSDPRDNVGDTITITVELEYEYDDSDVVDGSVTVNFVSFTYTGSLGMWSAVRQQFIVTDETFNSVVVSGNLYGITDVNQNTQSQTIIWDRIRVFTTLANDTRLDTGAYSQIWVTLQLEYDSTFLGTGDSVILNGVAMTWDGVDSRFELNRQNLTVGQWMFYVSSSLETTHGISALNFNSQNVSVIWDQIRILTTVVDDPRVNVGSNVELRVTAELVFDGHQLGSGDTIIIDSSSMNWDGVNIWFDLTRSQASVGLWTYQVDSAFEANYGISALDLNGQSQQVIWDQLVINIVADMDSVSNGVRVNFTVTVTFQYDSAPCTTYTITITRNATHWHTFTNANKSSFFDTNSGVVYNYTTTLVVSETTYGITVFSTNTETVTWGGGVTAPVNDSAPVLTNPDDTDFMYARLRFYVITSNVSDAQGYADVDYVELSLWDNTRSNEVWRIRYTESTNAFTIELGAANITLTGSSYVKSLNDIDITWVLKIDWDHIDLSNVDVRQYVVDESTESDTNWYESDWNVETRLDYSVSPSLSDDRGDLNTNDLVMTGTVAYYGSSLNPLANETDVWILHDLSGTWSGNVSVAGVFSIGGIASYASVRLNTYTIKVVIDGDGSGGTDLYYTSSVTTEFITDRIEFYLSGVLDGRINVNATGTVWWNARYDYDNEEITGGLTDFLLNGSKTLVWDSINSRWSYSESIQSVSRVGYSVLSVTSESGYGLTGWTQTASDTSIIWDLVVVRLYSITDSRVNITDFVDIDVLLEYEYDDSIVDNGTVTINSVSATHQGSGIWRISESRSSVVSVTYNSVSCSGNTHGISLVNQNSQSETIIWDRVFVSGYSVTDNHVNVDDLVDIDVTLVFEFDSLPVTTGNVTINGYEALHQSGGVWRITQTHSTAQGVTFDTVACNDTTYGITVIDQNGQSQLVIWDQIVVISYTVLDDRVNVGDNVSIDVLLHYDYDGSQVTDGTVSINSVSAEYQGSGVWRITVSELAVGNNTYNSVDTSGNSFVITSVDQNSQSQQVIWDQVAVRSLTASDDRGDVGSTITVFVTLEYEHDDSDVTDGSVIINTVSFTYTGANGIWFTDRSQSIVTSETYASVAVSGNNYGISNVDLGGASTTIIWDRIRILTTTVDADRLSTDSTARIMVIAELEYDGTLLGDGDSLFLDDSLMTWDGGNDSFYLDVSQSSVGMWNYYVNTSGAAESTYVISVVNTMSLSQNVIWDRLLITITPDDVSVVDFTDVSFTLDLEFDYDDSVCTTYLVDVSRNGTYWKSFTSINVSQFVDNNADTTYQYRIQIVVSESTYDITGFASNTVEVSWTTPANFAPFNNGAPTLHNPDDTDNLYSRLRFYLITSSIVDYDGYTDVDYIELSLWDNSRFFEVWRVRYTSATQSFSIEAGSEYVQLISGLNLSIGNLINVTWSIKIDWDHFDLQNIDIQQFVVDSLATSDADWFESDWDVETRLDYSIMPSLSDDWGDVDTADLQASGTVVYYGSSISPLSTETDVWVIHDFSGSWSGNLNGIGELSVVGIGSSSLVRLNTYTFKVVGDGLGSASADLFYSKSPTSTFITDRIEFYISGVADFRININEMGDVWWSARYQYNGSDIESGLTVYLNGINLLTWDTNNNRWHYQEARISPMQILYQISSATESGIGITNWITSTTNQSVIWDSLIISITDPFDQRTNVNTNATGITVSAIYSYDSTRFDGTILLNNDTFLFSSIHRQYYTVTSVSGDSYGISVISANDQTWCIWDQIEVVSINTNITYLDPSEYVRVSMELRYDFDDAPVTLGNFSLKFEELVHLADGIWEANVTRISYQTVNFDTLTICEATAFGISAFDMYGIERVVYWDRLEFYESYAVDSRIDVGSTGYTQWSVKLQNAGIKITSGITGLITGSVSLTYVGDFWRSSHTSDVVGDQTFTIILASLEGIDFFTRSANDVTIIWDRIQVLTISASSTNPEIEQFIIISVTLSYEYDGTEVTDGVVTLWDEDLASQITMTFNVSGGFWYANITKVAIGEYYFSIEAVSGNQFGITILSLEVNQLTVEFVPPALPQLTPMMIAGIGTGVFAIVLISSILVRRRYFVEIPYEIRQIDEILEAMEKEEKIEEIDVKPAERSIFDLLEPGMVELGLTMEEIMESIDDADLEEIRITDVDAEIDEVLEEFELLEEVVEEIPRKIRKSERTGEFEELDVEAYTDIEAAAEEALALMLEEVRKIKETSGLKVPLTKEDWLERIPSQVKLFFFEEELQNLDISEIEELTQLTPNEVEELLQSITEFRKSDSIDPESSATDIQDAIQKRSVELSEEEIDQEGLKARLIQTLPLFVIEFFSKAWLEKMSGEELNELTQLSEAELRKVVDTLRNTQASGI